MGFTLPRDLRLTIALAIFFAVILFLATPASTQISRDDKALEIEFVGGKEAAAKQVLVKFHASATLQGRAQASKNQTCT